MIHVHGLPSTVQDCRLSDVITRIRFTLKKKKKKEEEKNTAFVLPASASKTYIGSVLFRASAFIDAKLASGVPAVIRRFGP